MKLAETLLNKLKTPGLTTNENGTNKVATLFER